jgi:cytoskeletal protein CcmA (bactofilin family)
MWKRKEDEEAEGGPVKPQSGFGGMPQGRSDSPRVTAPVGGPAHLGRSVMIKGELTGSEDLYVDGTLEGTIQLPGSNLTVGPNGRVRAGIHARGVIIEGKVDGDIEASERVELRKTAVLMGSIVTQRVVIEDGAYFKGGVDVKKAAPAPIQPRPEMKHEPAPAASSAAAASGSASQAKAPVLEQKKS